MLTHSTRYPDFFLYPERRRAELPLSVYIEEQFIHWDIRPCVNSIAARSIPSRALTATSQTAAWLNPVV